mmetsp:Transcript_28039/g.26889  ORF Transcript_28039/g.26889 Transcript_28039/m.26889 type:complete len:297 (-) Transcript_28039:60-950(-)
MGADLFVGGGLLKFTGQVNNGNIDGRNTESHTSKLALKCRDNLGNSLGSTSGGGDDVAGGGTSSTPVLTRGRVNDSLGGSHSVNGSHESLSNGELIIDGLDHRGKTVGSTGGTRDKVLRTIVLVLVDTHNNSLGVILGRGGVDDLLGTSINDSLGSVLGKEDSGRLANVVSSESTPANLLRITTTGSHNLLSVKDEVVIIRLNSSLSNSVDGIILVLVCHVIRSGRSGIDSVKFGILVFHDDTGDKTSNTSETVDTHTSGHGHGSIIGNSGAEGRARERGGGKGGGRADGGNKSGN